MGVHTLHASQPPATVARIHCLLLALLMAAFLLRVGAQAIQAWHPVAQLAEFDAWHSATLPYWLLLLSQIVILAAQLWVLAALLQGRLRARMSVGITLLILGGAYFAFMLFRLIGGLTFLRDVAWFQVILPTIFHLVLAGFLLVLADYHLRFAGRDIRAT